MQIQTEYAHRPKPRLTTSIISGGQVIHKIQQDLKNPITSFKEKTKIEDLLRKQHFDVLNIVRNKDFELNPVDNKKSRIERKNLSLAEKLRSFKGVEKVFRLNGDGQFDSEGLSDDFRKMYSSILKSIQEVIDIFMQLPGGSREKGIVELDRNRLYLLSTGHEYYFLLVNYDADIPALEKQIDALTDS